jgi:hypothetical protein
MKTKPLPGRPNPGIGQPLPPKPVDKRYNKDGTPPSKYEDDEIGDGGSNLSPAESDEEFGPDIRRKFRERRMNREGGDFRGPPPPSRSPMGRDEPTSPMPSRTPRPVPGPTPGPVQSQNPRQSRLRYKLLERRKNG